MKKTLFTTSVFLLAILGCTRIMAQNLRTTESVTEPTQSVVGNYVDGSGQLLRVIRDNQGQQKLTTGPSAGATYASTLESIIFPSGKTLKLNPLERVLSVTGNRLLTRRTDPASAELSFLTYNVVAENLVNVGSAPMTELEVDATQFGSGCVVVRDLSEGYGTFLQIYSPEMKLLNNYTPFEDGYIEMKMSASEKILAVVFMNQAGEKKAAIFNPVTGRLINEGLLNTNIEPGAVRAFDDVFVLFGFGEMAAFNLNGSKVWGKSGLTAPNYDILSDKTNVYLFTNTDLVGIESLSGKVLWTKPLSTLLTNASAIDPNSRIRPVGFVNDGEEPGFVLAMVPKGFFKPTQVKTNSKFIQFDRSGTIKKQFIISGDKKFITVQPMAGGFKVLTNNETLTYEN